MMKVLQINDSDEFQKLQLRDKRYIYQVMDDFFKKYPKEYRRNYDRNLSETSLLLVDELGGQVRAEYYADVDKIAYSDSDYIVHELMHMAHYDRDKDIMAIEQKNNTMGDSLIEGAAEYLASQAMGVANDGYIFQTFVIDMLSDIDNFFEPFFIPNYKKFIRLFRRRDIYDLIWGLDYYHNNYDIEYEDDRYIEVSKKLGVAIRQVIDSLIMIEKRRNRSIYDKKKYYEKFMDLISDDIIKINLEYYFDEYRDYTNREIKSKILRR